jgi:exopolyphosphatase / guanosine-5'-triphosphate,3'-diphosphate pyrophosphatase
MHQQPAVAARHSRSRRTPVKNSAAKLPGLAESTTDQIKVMAAVDLGSNSFHMVVARLQHGQILIIDRLREMVRLASGLDRQGSLDSASEMRALECLQRFGERLRDMHAHQVRVVGTNTLRKARRANDFLQAAEAALEHPVEVISGIEEARLIFLGVSHHGPGTDGPILVLDIGGGSTELIIGQDHEPALLESLYMGCVAWSSRYFPGGELTRKRFDKARLAARLELHPVVEKFRRHGWKLSVGSSGTIRAAERVARALDLIDGGLTIDALEAMVEKLIDAGHVDNLQIPELSEQRAPVFAGGVAILVEAMRTMQIDVLQISEGALREGLLYDMLGRIQHEDARDRTIRAIQGRYNIDTTQATRVEATALQLLNNVINSWDVAGGEARRYLSWAAQLHEIGLDIAHTKYQEHGGYLIANADLPGFSQLDQQIVAILVAHHRRKVEELKLAGLSENWQRKIPQLLLLFRLAVLLHRSRSPAELPEIRVVANKNKLQVYFPEGWLDDNRLTMASLEQETLWVEVLGYELSVGSFQQA